MLTITARGNPPSGNHWSYGPEFMQRIGRAAALKLCGMYPLPEVGYQTIVALAADGFGGYRRLEVQNISGDFYAACTNVKVGEWPEVFRVRLVGVAA